MKHDLKNKNYSFWNWHCYYVLVPATITNVSSDKALLEGSDLQLFCIASGRPAPNITWVRIFPSSSESNVLHRGTTWDFKKISRTEAGSYRCIASNGVGNPVSRTLRVNVECEYMYMHVVYLFISKLLVPVWLYMYVSKGNWALIVAIAHALNNHKVII